MPEGDDRTFSMAEHEALLTDAVRRERETAKEEFVTELDDLRNRVDVLEAEKAEAVAAKEKAEQDLADYKAEVETAQEVDARKADRVAAVKEISSTDLPESYFTDTRVQRWAEMADEDFTALLDDMAMTTIASLSDEEQAELDKLEGEARRAKVIELAAARKGNGEETEREGAFVPERRETAAFTGGTRPTTNPSAGGSTLGRFLGATGHRPADN